MATEPKPTLPLGCPKCRGASHIVTERGATRCDCARGQMLAQLEYERKHPEAKPAKRERRKTHDGKAAAIGGEA